MKSKKSSHKSISIALLAIAVFLIVLILVDHLIGLPRPGIALDGKLTKTQEKTIDLVVDLSKTLISWGIAIIGGFIYFFKSTLEANENFDKMEKTTFLLGSASALFSLFFGYVLIESIANSLSHNVLDIRDPTIAVPALMQFFNLIVALGSLLMHVYLSSFTKKRG